MIESMIWFTFKCFYSTTSLCLKSKTVALFARLRQMQNLEIYGFHCTLKMFSHVSLHFKIMKVRTYPFAINRCSFCKQLLQLKSLTPSICLSSSAVMGGGSQEQFITSFTWSQAATFFIPNSYFDSLAWFCLNYSQKFWCHQRYWRATSCSPLLHKSK